MGIIESRGGGGNGGRGIDGILGLGGTGAPGLNEEAVTTAGFSNTSGQMLQIGGDGGAGGQGGQGGSGGGGGGGAGSYSNYFIPTGGKPGGSGGSKGDGGAGGSGGDAGKGTIDVRYNGRFINETGGWVEIGRGSLGGEGEFKVRPGGELTNSSGITINENGKLDVLGGTVSNNIGGTINNKGTIDNNGIFVNNGMVNNDTGEFFNYGLFKGTGTYVGDFDNNGVVAPGNSIGEMNIDGGFFNGGALEIEIGGFETGLYDFLEITGTASFSENSMISFLSWNDYDFSDILPHQSKSLEFLYADDGILDFYSAIAFGDGFLPAGFDYDVFNDGHGLFLEVTNTVPIPSAVWLLGFGLVSLLGIRKRLNK